MNTYQNDINLQSLYVILLSFKVYQPTKRKYKLSFNLLFCLTGIYLYSVMIKETFSRTGIYNFITYFNYNVIKRYFDIYLQRKLIIQVSNDPQLYKLTQEAINIIEEIPKNYNKVMYEFSNKYNIDL